MPKKGEEEEIVVPPPAFRRDEPLLRDTTGVEALDVSKISMKIGNYLSSLMLIVGAVLSVSSIYGIVASVHFLFSNPLFIGAMLFLGAINFFCGLILLARE